MSYQRYKLVIFAAATEGSLLLLALMLAQLFDISLTPLTKDVVRDIAIGTAGAVPPFILFSFLISERASSIPGIRELRDVLRGPIRDLFEEATIIDIIGIALLAGFAEECLFRGVLQVRFGIVAASIVFGLAHLITPAYFVIALVMGAYLGLFFQYTGSLLAVIHLHFLYDLLALVYLRYRMK